MAVGNADRYSALKRFRRIRVSYRSNRVFSLFSMSRISGVSPSPYGLPSGRPAHETRSRSFLGVHPHSVVGAVRKPPVPPRVVRERPLRICAASLSPRVSRGRRLNSLVGEGPCAFPPFGPGNPAPTESPLGGSTRITLANSPPSAAPTTTRHRIGPEVPVPSVAPISAVCNLPLANALAISPALPVMPFASNRQAPEAFVLNASRFAFVVEEFSQENPTDQREVREDPQQS